MQISYSDGLGLSQGTANKNIGYIYHDNTDTSNWIFNVNNNGTGFFKVKVNFDNLPSQEYYYILNSSFPQNFTAPNISLYYFYFDNETIIHDKSCSQHSNKIIEEAQKRSLFTSYSNIG